MLLTLSFLFSPVGHEFKKKKNSQAASHAWANLEEMSNERAVQKELGLFPFFCACFEMNNMQAATGYAIRIKKPEEQIEAFIMLEAWDDAADITLQMRSDDDRVDMMNMIAQRCHDPNIRPQILEKLKSAPNKKKRNIFGALF